MHRYYVCLSGALVVLCLIAAAFTPSAHGTSVVVGFDVPSSTIINPSGCPSSTAPETNFGVVLPGSTAVTTQDCNIGFGSTNDSSKLLLFQYDRAGEAMNSNSWAEQYTEPPPSNVLWGTVALDANTAWAVGTGGTILHTSDGGATWNAQTSGTTEDLDRIALAGTHTLWVTGYDGTVLKSVDGGTTWSAPEATGTTSRLDGLAAVDLNTVWAVGMGGTVVKSTNGGATWVNQTSAASACAQGHNLRGFSAVDADTAWAVGDAGTICKTTDGGATWVQQSMGIPAQNLRGVVGINGNIAYISGYYETILKTTDGGATWMLQHQDLTPPAGWRVASYRDIAAFDENTLWVAGWNGEILSTDDGGQHWIDQSTSITDDLRGVNAISRDVGWAVGDNFDILKVTQNPVADYAVGTPDDDAHSTDWLHGAGFFGVCLRDVGAGAQTDGTTWATNPSCPTVDNGGWHGVAATDTDAGAKIADAPSNTTGAVASLRFGIRAPLSQKPGVYDAPIEFEVLAPNL